MYDSKLNDAKSFMFTVHNLKTNQKSVWIIRIPGAGGEMGINVMWSQNVSDKKSKMFPCFLT